MGTGSWEAVDMAIPSTSVGAGSVGEVDMTMDLGLIWFCVVRIVCVVCVVCVVRVVCIVCVVWFHVRQWLGIDLDAART